MQRACDIMRPLLDVHLASAVRVLAALALAGCHSDAGRRADTLETKSVTLSVESSAPAAAPVFVPGMTSMQGSERDEDIYAAPPHHEPNGSPRFSDVGMPYPIPSADLDPWPPPPTPAALPAALPPSFVGTSLRPSYVEKGFPESSFGPDAEP
jgi:hypothetical protein